VIHRKKNGIQTKAEENFYIYTESSIDSSPHFQYLDVTWRSKDPSLFGNAQPMAGGMSSLASLPAFVMHSFHPIFSHASTILMRRPQDSSSAGYAKDV
jgi:hypothetical protein